MSTGSSQVSTYGRYVGRVGAMAAALGIGVMVITFPGVAHADYPPSTQASNESSTDNNAGSGGSVTFISSAGSPLQVTASGSSQWSHRGFQTNFVPSHFTTKSHFSLFQAVGSFLLRTGQPSSPPCTLRTSALNFSV